MAVRDLYFCSQSNTSFSSLGSVYSVKEKENTSLVFSGDREIPTRGSTIPVGNEALPSFPLERWTRGLGFPSSTVHQ